MTTRNVEVRLSANDASYASTIKRDAELTKSFAESANGANTHLGNMGRSTKQVSGFLDGYRTSAEHAAEASRKHGESLNLTAKAGQYVHDTLGLALGTMLGFTAAQSVITGVTAAWHEFVGATIEFDTNMRNVQSITKESDSSIAKMETTILGLSDTLPQSAGELSRGLYDIASSGFMGAAGLQVLKASAISASAGLSDTQTAARGITGVLNAYGMSAQHAAAVSDVMFQTVNLGVITFGELSQGIGDYIGTAAVLGVSFGETEAALAAMTLSGVTAAESGTALNRMLTALIKPSAEMTSTLHSLGYENGITAVKALGLHGVMQLLFKSTGGTADKMAALFPEMRALRGALALGAADGKNYDRTFRGIADAHAVAGAAAAALREQQKSLGYQMQVTGNNIRNAFIGIGADLAPALARGLASVRSLGDGIGTIADRIAHEFAPAFRDVGEALSSLGQFGGQVLNVMRPLLEVLGGAAIGAAGVVFRALAAALKELADFLDHNRVAADALAAVLTAKLVVGFAGMLGALPALTGLTGMLNVRMGQLGLSALGFFQKMEGGVGVLGAARASFSELLASINPIGVALAVVAAGWIAYNQAADHANQNASQQVANFEKNRNLDSLAGLDEAYQAAGAKAMAAQDKLQRSMAYSGKLSGLRELADNLNPFADNTLERYKANVKKWEAEESKIVKIRQGTYDALDKIRSNVGLKVTDPTFAGQANANTTAGDRSDAVFAAHRAQLADQRKAVMAWASAIGVDLPKAAQEGTAATAKAIAKVTDSMKRAGDSGVVSGKAIKSGLLSADDAQAAIDAFKKYADAIGQGLSKTTDILQTFGGKATTNADITKFYKGAVDSTQTFLDNISKAFKNGYDPELVGRLLAAGPEQAGPILQRLADTTDKKYVDMVNNAEAKLKELTAKAIEFGRLQTMATSGGLNSQQAGQLPIAMQIDQALSKLQGSGQAANANTIAFTIGLPPDVVQQVANDYKIVIGKVQPIANATPLQAQLQVMGAPEAEGKVHHLAEQFHLTDRKVVTLLQAIGAPDAESQVRHLAGQFHLTERQVKSILQAVGGPDAEFVVSALYGKLHSVERNFTAEMKAADLASNVIDPLLHKLGLFTGSHQADFTVAHGGGKATAMGGIRSGPHALLEYAYGGIAGHQPKVWRPGDGYLFNEPETSGEALIPLANDGRRARAVAVTADVAGRFGYGLVPAGRGSGHAMAGASGMSSRSSGGLAVTFGPTSVQLGAGADTSTLDAYERKQARRDDRMVRKIRAATVGVL